MNKYIVPASGTSKLFATKMFKVWGFNTILLTICDVKYLQPSPTLEHCAYFNQILFFSLAVMLEEEQCLLLLVQAVINIYIVVYIFPIYDNSPKKIRLNYRGINNIRNTYIESKWIRVSIWRNSIPFLSFMGVSMQTIYKFLCSQQIIRLLL